MSQTAMLVVPQYPKVSPAGSQSPDLGLVLPLVWRNDSCSQSRTAVLVAVVSHKCPLGFLFLQNHSGS